MSPEWRCPLNRGVPKERFHCIWVQDSGAHFSKVPIINGPVKLFWFTRKTEVSIVLHLT